MPIDRRLALEYRLHQDARDEFAALEDSFDLDHHLRQVDTILARVFDATA